VTHVGGDGDDDLDMTLTAHPSELKELLRTYADNKSAFRPDQSLVFTRK
jgi:hypothetical protein